MITSDLPMSIVMSSENLKLMRERNIKTELVLSKIGEMEALEATEAEVDEEIKVFADAYGHDFEEYKKGLQERMLDYIKANIIKKKKGKCW